MKYFYRLISSILLMLALFGCSATPDPVVQGHSADEQKANAANAQQELKKEVNKLK
jgi:PBP1b-binding outer membrane lipoprotein LpoB